MTLSYSECANYKIEKLALVVHDTPEKEFCLVKSLFCVFSAGVFPFTLVRFNGKEIHTAINMKACLHLF